MANWYVSSNAYSNIKPWGGYTNLLLQSQTFSDASWTKTNIGDTTFATTTTAPDGTNTAVLLTENATTSQHSISQTYNVALTASQAFVFSVYAKPGQVRTRLCVQVQNTGGTALTMAYFDLATGFAVNTATVSSGYSMLNYGTAPAANGYTRCYIVVLCTSAVTAVNCLLALDNQSGQGALTNNYPGNSANGVYIWGAQLEKGTHVGKYTATTTAAATTVGSFTASVGDLVRQSANIGAVNVGSERVFRCTTAGTTGSSEPSPAGGNPWNVVKSGTTADGTVVWTEVTAQEAYSTAGAWCAAARLSVFNSSNNNYCTTATVVAGGTGYAVGDVVRPTTGTAFGDYAYFKVAAVSSGAVTSLTILSGGSYITGPSAASATTAITGTGSGLTTTSLEPATNWLQAAGDTIYLGSSHAESMNAAYTINPATSTTAPANLICVDETASGSVPPTSLGTSGASVATLGSNALTIAGNFTEIYGISFRCGSGSGSPNLSIGNAAQHAARFNSCVFALPATGSGAVALGGVTGNFVALENTTFLFGGVGQGIIGHANMIWRNTAAPLQGAAVPTSLIGTQAGWGGQFVLEGLDLSTLGSGKSIISVLTAAAIRTTLKNCRLGSAVTISATPSTPGYNPTDVINCDSGTSYYRNERYRGQGTLTTDPVVTRTGGAADGSTAISHKIVTSTQAVWPLPFESFPVAIYNSTVASIVTVTVCGLYNGAALPTNDQFWLQVSYLGSASSPIATINNATKANILATGTSLTADTSAWDANVTARANSTAYTVGQTIKASSNSGRVFFCTTAGTSSSSLPAGYASAVDGGSVTDGTAVFRAGMRFKQSVALSSPTPQAAGLITVTPKVGLASATYYVDPLITLS